MNILVVDDEPKVLRGMKAIIERSGRNWKVVGECKNGLDALNAIKEVKPDVVITDIKMPCMNGLELVEQARAISADIKFIILSGFPDFTYAQQAIRLETIDYILKPPDLNDIIKSLEKAENSIREKEARRREKDEIDRIRSETEQKAKDDLFRELLFKGIAAKDPAFDCGMYALFLVMPDNCSFMLLEDMEGKLKEMAELRDLVRSAVYRRHGCMVDFLEGTYCCWLKVANDSPVYLKGLAREIRSELSAGFSGEVSLGVSCVYSSPEDMRAAYKDCLYILRNKVFYDKGSIILKNELKAEKCPDAYPVELEHKYVESLQFGNFDKSADILMQFISQAASIAGGDPEAFKGMIMEFVITVSRSMSELRMTEGPDAIPGAGIYRKLSPLDSIDEVKAVLLDYTKSLADFFSEKNRTGCRKIIQEIKNHVARNYYSDVTLRELSNTFFMNESYLSDLFKKETGISFSAYLTQVRLEHAKALLKQMDLKPHEIAAMVGYHNSRYFNKVFKKHFGMTPFEYREKLI